MAQRPTVHDNAFAESFWSRLKAELLEEDTSLSLEAAQTEIFTYTEINYN